MLVALLLSLVSGAVLADKPYKPAHGCDEALNNWCRERSNCDVCPGDQMVARLSTAHHQRVKEQACLAHTGSPGERNPGTECCRRHLLHSGAATASTH